MMPAPAIATGYGGRLTVDLGALEAQLAGARQDQPPVR